VISFKKILYLEKFEFVNSSDQLACGFTKSLHGPIIDYICNKHYTYDLYVPP